MNFVLKKHCILRTVLDLQKDWEEGTESPYALNLSFPIDTFH